MKKAFLLSAAMMAVLAGPALAQDRGDRDHDGNRGGGGRPPAAQAQHAPAPQVQHAPAPQAQHAAPAPQAQRGPNPGTNRGNFGRNDNNRPDFNRGNAQNNAGRNDNNRPGVNNNANNRPAFNGNNNRGGARPNYAQYHRSFNAPQRYRYRGPTYQRPSGWYARRWTYGDFLPALFWGSQYWIDDFGYYDLMPPPPGTVWVRDGSDALLIDRYTGEVIQVEYNIFY